MLRQNLGALILVFLHFKGSFLHVISSFCACYFETPTERQFWTFNMSDQSRQKATVFVGGLDNQVTTQTLHDAFIPFGDIVDVSLPKPEL